MADYLFCRLRREIILILSQLSPRMNHKQYSHSQNQHQIPPTQPQWKSVLMLTLLSNIINPLAP